MSEKLMWTWDGLSREEKIKLIYEVVWYNEYIEDMMWRLSDYEAHHKTMMIWDVIYRLDDYVESKYWSPESYVAREKYKEILFEVMRLREDTRRPIEDSYAVSYVYSLLEAQHKTT